MLVFMRALPGRETRVAPDAPPAEVTRTSAHADQRRRILGSVGELVAASGYGEVTVELIVKRARVSYKTFYKHFAGKEECFAALFDETFASIEAGIEDQLAEDSRPWPERVARALGAFVELIVADPVIARAVIVETPTVGPGLRERYEGATKAFTALFREGRKLNPRGAELPETIEETLSGSVFWSAYQRLIVGQAEQLPELLPDLIELVLQAYLGTEEAERLARAAASEHLVAA
jgi:AcrR family transcriptional regulator